MIDINVGHESEELDAFRPETERIEGDKYDRLRVTVFVFSSCCYCSIYFDEKQKASERSNGRYKVPIRPSPLKLRDCHSWGQNSNSMFLFFF